MMKAVPGSHRQDRDRDHQGSRRSDENRRPRRHGGLGADGFSNALQSKAYPSSGVSLSPAAVIYSKIPYAGVFEEGATIAGRLWLPIEANLPLQARGKRWTPKGFSGGRPAALRQARRQTTAVRPGRGRRKRRCAGAAVARCQGPQGLCQSP